MTGQQLDGRENDGQTTGDRRAADERKVAASTARAPLLLEGITPQARCVASGSSRAGASATPTTWSRYRRSLAASLQSEWICCECRARAPHAFAGVVSSGSGCVARARETTMR